MDESSRNYNVVSVYLTNKLRHCNSLIVDLKSHLFGGGYLVALVVARILQLTVFEPYKRKRLLIFCAARRCPYSDLGVNYSI